MITEPSGPPPASSGSVWGTQGLGEVLSGKISGLPHQDESGKGLAGLQHGLGWDTWDHLLQSWEKKEQGSRRSK